MNRKKIIIILFIVVLNIFVAETEAKRSFSIRTRKTNSGRNLQSRRKSNDHNPNQDTPLSPGSSAVNHHAPNVERTERHALPDPHINSHHSGPPPPYPGLGGGAGGLSNGPPPSYGQAMGKPPSYAESQRVYTNGYGYPQNSHIQSIPPRGQPNPHGLGDATSFQGLGTGPSSYGAPMYVGGGAQMPGGGLYHNLPNQPGTTYNGMGSGYGSGYGYGQTAGSPFSFGNMLTGLALWNIARGHNSYPSERHYHVHNNEGGVRDEKSVTETPPPLIAPTNSGQSHQTQPLNINKETGKQHLTSSLSHMPAIEVSTRPTTTQHPTMKEH